MIFEYIREDGAWEERSFPIGKAPSEILCDDGVLAKRGWKSPPAIAWKEGQESESEKIRKREARTRDNINAGNRGRNEWRERMPKLHLA